MDDQHMPRTSVAFAATVPFSKRWPDEAKAQMKKFERSTWAQEVVEPDAEEAPKTDPAPVVEETTTTMQLLVCGSLFVICIGVGAFLFYKWQQQQ